MFFSPLNLSLTNTRRVLINDTRTNKLLGILRFFWTWTWSWLLVRPKKKLSNPRLKGQALKKPAPLQHWMRCKCKSIRLRLIASLEQLVSSWHRMALGKAHFVPLEQATDHELLYYYILLCVIQNCIVRFMFKSKYFLLKVCMTKWYISSNCSQSRVLMKQNMFHVQGQRLYKKVPKGHKSQPSNIEWSFI